MLNIDSPFPEYAEILLVAGDFLYTLAMPREVALVLGTRGHLDKELVE